MNKVKGDKIERILEIYTKLLNGTHISKDEIAKYFGVNERSIQRDIDDIRNYLSKEMKKEGFNDTIAYDNSNKKYYMMKLNDNMLTNTQALEVFKILLSSRVFLKEDLQNIINKILTRCVCKTNTKELWEFVQNYFLLYHEPKHKINFSDNFFEIAQAIKNKHYLKFEYINNEDEKVVVNKIKPLSITFFEFYFYLSGVLEKNKEKAINLYRLDKISRVKVLNETFIVKYSEDMDDQNYYDSLQFETEGKLKKITFKYIGKDIYDILNRFPNAKILYCEKDSHIIQIKTFGDGAIKWLKDNEFVVDIVE